MKPNLFFYSILSFCIFLFSLPAVTAYSQDTIPVIIDADTGNEVDDLYAIVRGLLEPTFDVLGLSSAQWGQSHWAPENSLEESQRLNVLLLAYLHRDDLPHPRGSRDRLYDWGQDIAQHSAAAYFIIKKAHEMPPGKKLTLLVLGASTNIASALLIDPTIVDKIDVYLLGTSYDEKTGIWRKEDFNCINDIHAINILLGMEGLSLHVMPHSTAAAMKFEMTKLKEKFSNRHPLLEYLYLRWFNHIDGGRYWRTIWDLALVETVAHPEWAKETTVAAPPENGARLVHVYTAVNADKMRNDFYEVMLKSLSD